VFSAVLSREVKLAKKIDAKAVGALIGALRQLVKDNKFAKADFKRAELIVTLGRVVVLKSQSEYEELVEHIFAPD
jgi:hypothetical protein